MLELYPKVNTDYIASLCWRTTRNLFLEKMLTIVSILFLSKYELGDYRSIHRWKVHIGLQFRRWQYGSIFIRLSVIASEIWEMWLNSNRIWSYTSSRSSKVIHLGVNEKPICDFLLVSNCNFSRICYHFWDIHAWRYCRKLLISPTPPLMDDPARGNPLAFLDETYLAKTGGMELLYVDFNRFLRYWRLKGLPHSSKTNTIGRKSPILPTMTLKPGSGVTRGHWFWYQWKECAHIPISDQ